VKCPSPTSFSTTTSRIHHEAYSTFWPCTSIYFTDDSKEIAANFLPPKTRALTQVKYSSDGDLIFTVSKDQLPSVWFSANGERLGSYQGHVGAVWTVDVNPETTLLATGAADNTIRLWDVKTGKLLKTWEFESSIKRVEFSPDGRQLLGVTEKRTNILSSIVVYDIIPSVEAEQSSEHALRIICEESKATVAGFGFDAKYIIAGHEDGSVSQFDGQVGFSS
jgi:translation initiation factor 3 subunit I